MEILSNEAIREFYGDHFDESVIDDQMILYETRDGQSIVDSPFAMFQYLASHPSYRGFKHIWVLATNDPKVKQVIPESYAEQVEFVVRNSRRYVECLLTAKYLINNSTFQSFFSKRPGQCYINTWHGTPLKYMGFDIPGDPAHSQNVLRNLLMTDFLITPNEHTTHIFADSYRMRGSYPGTVLEAGYPRIDFTFQTDPVQVRTELVQEGLTIDDDLPIVLYMPTWRGSSVGLPITNIDQIGKEVAYLRRRFSKKYNILVKVHPYVYDYACRQESLRSFLVPNYMDANRLLAGTDILVTDFSSVFVDFLVTGKPILFYCWDADLYDDERGMYYPLERLPGPVCDTVFQLGDYLATPAMWQEEYQNRYELMKKELTHYDDGMVSERIVEAIFQQKAVNNVKKVSLFDQRKKLLIHAGGMRNNGITSSLLNLLHSLNYEKYDVTLLCQAPNQKNLANINRIPVSVRILFKPGGPIYSATEVKLDKKWQENQDRTFYPEEGYDREVRRILAGLKFDYAIDFSGYSFYWGKFIAHADAVTKGVYQHNDLSLEADKVINGKKPHMKNLKSLFLIYDRFDKIISVSDSLRKINCCKLSSYIPESKTYVVMNGLNLKRLFTDEERTELKKKVVRTSFQITVAQSEYLCAYSSLNNVKLRLGKTFVVNQADVLTVVASTEIDHEQYYKLMLNGLYIGWMMAENINGEKKPVIIQRKQSSLVASFRHNRKSPIYMDIPYQEETDVLRGYSNFIENRYIWVRETVLTNLGEYYHIFDRHRALGWVKKNALSNFHEISKKSLLNLYFSFKNAKKSCALPDKLLIDQKIMKFKEGAISKFVVYSAPKGTEGSFVKFSEYQFSRDEIVTVLMTAWIGNHQWYLIESSGDEVGWIETTVNNVQVLPNHFAPKAANVVNRVSKMLVDKGHNFVMMGRFSPEKNQENLIIAFADFLSIYPDSRLFFIGEGPTLEKTKKLVSDLNIARKVVFLEHFENPFPVLKLFDTFVLPSLYEGQPMVLLEALSLGLKIVASNIPQNVEVLENGRYGLLTKGTSSSELLEGLIEIEKHKLPFAIFDAQKYNNSVIKQFESLVDS